MQDQGDEVAAIILEPVAGNMGAVPPKPGFLEGLRHWCDQTGSLLIFDEVMTGFRVALGGHDRDEPPTCGGGTLVGGHTVAVRLCQGGRVDRSLVAQPVRV